MSTNSEFPVPTHTTVSRYHLAKLEEKARDRDVIADTYLAEIDRLAAQVREAQMWAARFYRGWECNDNVLPDWIRDKEVPHGKTSK